MYFINSNYKRNFFSTKTHNLNDYKLILLYLPVFSNAARPTRGKAIEAHCPRPLMSGRLNSIYKIVKESMNWNVFFFFLCVNLPQAIYTQSIAPM